MFFGKRSLETWLSNSILGSQEICPSFSQPAVGLYIIGHSGGDWNHNCEHSLEATEYALNGDYHANGIELDIRFDTYSLVPKERNVTLVLQVILIRSVRGAITLIWFNTKIKTVMTLIRIVLLSNGFAVITLFKIYLKRVMTDPFTFECHYSLLEHVKLKLQS